MYNARNDGGHQRRHFCGVPLLPSIRGKSRTPYLLHLDHVVLYNSVDCVAVYNGVFLGECPPDVVKAYLQVNAESSIE